MARKRQDDTDQLARIDRHVGSRIREIRKARGLSTEALAEVVGISPGQFAKYEVAGTRVCVGNLYMVARHLGVPVTMFFPDAGKVGVAPAAHAVRLATLVDLFESIPDPHLKRALVATSGLLRSSGGGLGSVAREMAALDPAEPEGTPPPAPPHARSAMPCEHPLG